MKTQRYVKLSWDRCLVLLFHYQQDLRCTDVMFNVVWSRGITMHTGALPYRVHVHVLSQPLLVLDVSLGVAGRNSISSSNVIQRFHPQHHLHITSIATISKSALKISNNRTKNFRHYLI